MVGTASNSTADGGGLDRKLTVPDATGVQLWGEGRGEGRFIGALRWPDAYYYTSDGNLADGKLVAFGLRRSGRDRVEMRINGRVSGRVMAPVVDVSAPGKMAWLGRRRRPGLGPALRRGGGGGGGARGAVERRAGGARVLLP